MDQMLKWIGGAAAATVFVLGGATLASTMMSDDGASEEIALQEAIPVDPAQLAPKQGGDDAQLQPASAEADTPAKEDAFTVKRILDIDGPIKYGEWHWNTENVPADGAIVMTVDLDARVISVFKGGYEIGASAVLLGTDDHPTPLGTFPIKYKMRHNVSEKYDNAPMPYSMFLTNDGIALHGSDVQNGYASHGCIGMPDDFAAKVFAVAKKGDKVIITKGETLDMGQSIL